MIWSLFVRRPSVCMSVGLSVCQLFTFSTSPEPRSQFKQTLYETSVGEKDSILIILFECVQPDNI